MADGSDSATTRSALVDGRSGPTAPPREHKEDDDQQEGRSTPKSPAETRSCSSSLVGRIAESLAEARGCAGRAASAAVERMRRVADSAFALPPNVDAADTKAVHAYTEYLHEEFSSRNEDAKEKTPFFCPPLADSSSLMRSEQHTEATSSSPKPLPDVIPRDDNKAIVPDLQVDLNENPRKPSFMQKEPEDPDSLSCESEFADSNEDVAEDSTLLRDLVLLKDDSEYTTSDSRPQDRMDLGSALNKLEKDEQRKSIVGGDQRARATAHDVAPKQQHGLPAGRLQQHQRVVPAAGAVLRLRPQPVPQQRPRAHGGPGRLRRRPGPVHRAPRLLQEVPAVLQVQGLLGVDVPTVVRAGRVPQAARGQVEADVPDAPPAHHAAVPQAAGGRA